MEKIVPVRTRAGKGTGGRGTSTPLEVFLPSVRLTQIALHYQDASRALPVAMDMAAIDSEFAVEVETLAEGLTGAVRDARLSLTSVLASETDAETPLMQLERLTVSDLAVDLGAD